MVFSLVKHLYNNPISEKLKMKNYESDNMEIIKIKKAEYPNEKKCYL